MTEYEVINSAENAAAGTNDGVILTTTLWNQSGKIYVSIDGTQNNLGVDYNMYCPIYNGSSRAVTGCTNTADAQIIYYWMSKGYADEMNFTVTGSDYLYVQEDGSDVKVTVSSADSKYGLPSVSELNGLLANSDIVPQVGESWSGDKTELGNFIAALNLYCGIKNHSSYGKSTGTSSLNTGAYTTGSYAWAFAAAGFDSYYRIGVLGGSVGENLYNYATNGKYTFTKLGHSILQENLDYGEVIRIGIPGHAIYMDGYRLNKTTNEYEYHINYGWGNSSATKWYTLEQLANIKIDDIGIDISPDTNVVVSNTESKYWGGSFLRGMERVNHIQTERLAANDDAVEFEFADDIAGQSLELSDTAVISSKSDVEFKNINVDIYSNSVSKLFSSSYALSFDFNDGSITVQGDDLNPIIAQNNNKQVTLTLDDSFIYTGSYSGSTVSLLDNYSYSNLTDNFLATVTGSIVAAGSANDVVTLKGNSALLGDLELGGGSNVLNVESGSIFYGGFSGSNLTVNLTVNNSETGAMLVMTADGESAFLAAAGYTLNVSVKTTELAAGGAYVLYSGSMIEQVKLNLKIDNGTYQLYDFNKHTIANPDYTLFYDTENSQVKLTYAVSPATVSNIKATPVTPLDEDGLTAGNVIVTADFSVNATGKFYSIDGGKTWNIYPIAGASIPTNCSVIFKAVNAANEETISDSIIIDCIDKTPPPVLSTSSSNPNWTNGSVTLSAYFPENEPAPADFTEIKYSVDGGLNWAVYDENTKVTVETNGTVYFRAYDKRGNYSESHYTVSNIDKEKPNFQQEAIIGSGDEIARSVHIALDKSKITDNSNYDLTYYYSVDGSEWHEYTDNILFYDNITVYFKVIDAAGNESDVVSYNITNVDNVAPDRPVASANVPNDTKTNGSVTVTAVFDLASGDVAKVEWSLDGIVWYECGTVNPAENTFVYSATVENNTDFYFRSVDKVGNISEVTEYQVTNIDKTAPAIPVVTANTEKLTNQPVVLDVLFDRVSGDVVSNQYSFTGEDGDWHDYTESLVFYENGKVYFRSSDDVGNTSYSEYVVDNIDLTPPAVPVIKSDSDGRITDHSVKVWAEFGDREVAKIEYTIDGTTYLAFDPEQAIVAGNGEAITSVTLRAYDLAGNVSGDVTVELNNGLVEELPDWAWSNDDAVRLQYSYDNHVWYDFNSAIEFVKNDEVYFRALDEAGNISDVAYHKIGNIDDVADDKTMTKIFIDKDYTDDNTYGKRIDGVLLKYGENAFSSVEEAGKVYDFNDQSVRNNVQIIAEDMTAEDLENLENVKLLSAVQVAPEGSYTGTVYSYKSSGKAEKSIVLNGKNYSELTLEWFKNVSVNGSVLDDVDGGNAEVKTSQRYSNGGRTLTRSTAHTNSASGFFKAENGSTVNDVSGYLNVEIKDSVIGTLAGGKKNSSEDLKTTDNGKKYTESVKESSAAEGSVKLNKVTENGNIENYKNVELQWVTLTGLIENNKEDFSKSESYSEDKKKFTRNITVKQTLASDGSLKINHSTINGNIQGYDDVILNSVQVNDVSRKADDNGSYRKQNDSWKITQDTKTGVITGKLEESMTYTNGGSFSVAGEASVVGSVNNFSKVTVGGGAAVGNIRNNVMLKDEKSYLYIWNDSELYGDQELYQVNNTDEAKGKILESVEKHAANGTVTVSDKSQAGNLYGFDKVVVSGKSTVGSITALSLNRGNIICGSYEVKYKDTGKNKDGMAASGSVTETVTVKPAASVKLDSCTVNGSIKGYKSVTISKATVNGTVDMGDVYKAADVISYSTSKGVVTRTYSQSTSYTTGSGSLKMTDTKVNGSITGYAKVVMDNSSTVGWDIANSTAVKNEIKYNESWDSLEWLRDKENVISLEEFMEQNPQQNGLLFSKVDQAAANGSIALKNNSTAGNISGFKTVKLDGNQHDPAKAALTVGSISAIAGETFGSFKREEKFKYASKDGKNYTQAVTVAMAPAASATIYGYDVNGDISGYKTVKLTDVNVFGNVDRGSDSVEKSTTVYTTDKNGKVSKTVDTVITYKQNGSFSAVDTTAGSINGYNKVVLTNSSAGDIYQSTVVKEVKRDIYEGDNQILEDVVPTEKLTGSVELKDSKAGKIDNYKSVSINNSEVGVLTNVNKVTVSGAHSTMAGFTGTAGNDSLTVGKDSTMRISGKMDFAGGTADKITVNGTLVWENNAEITGLENIAGKGTIAASHALFTDVNNAFINNFAGTLLDLGNTSNGFRSEAFEAADNSKAAAFVWDGEDTFEGWLGIGDDVDCMDDVDYIKFVAKEHSTLIIASADWGAGVTDTVFIGDKEFTITDGQIEYNLKAGGEYLVQINRKDDNSMSYTMTIA